ncbi:ribonuclease H-like [Erinaceus europaeus]|uniref:Ribonuclease H-like n=1 Tax=Erinaceus europaeus TaxID=9365 RepID=A0ABM3YIQ5_ERIEU|nr:ribonuclease H-like [Erinaceus europaeus]
MIIIDQGTSHSTQHAEVIAALLAARKSLKERQDLHLFSDSWCVLNEIDLWSGKWEHTDWKINGKAIWSKEAWKELHQIGRDIKIQVYHVDAHEKDESLQTKYNNEVDK